MSSLNDTVAAGLIYNYADYNRRVRVLAEPLTDEQFWTRPYPYGNSIGNLVLHLTGNLSYYIGTQIAGTGYVRHRDLEFTATHPGQKEQVLANLDAAVAMVIETLKAQREEDWARHYTAIGEEDASNHFGVFLRCAAHFHHHIGQMIYLTKEWSRHEGR